MPIAGFLQINRLIAALVLAFALLAPSGADAQSSQVRVDVSVLREKGVGILAEVAREALAVELSRMVPRGARVIVRLDNMFLNGSLYDSDSSGRFSGMGPTDALSGRVDVVDPAGRVVDSFPLTVSVPSDSAGRHYYQGQERDRTVNLARDFAAWTARRF